ncbi:MAG TPA: histidine kinase [Candidatus Binatia bacterium]|nr:histidine kinase [Candidatus Binatia bacterium]
MRVHGASSEGWRRPLIFVALWTLLGLFVGSKVVIEHRVYGQSYPWFKALWWWLMEAYVWGLLSLVVARTCRRLVALHSTWPRKIASHLVMGSALSVVQGVVATTAGLIEVWAKGWPLTPVGPYSFSNALKLTVVNHFHSNLLVYAAIVLGWHALNYYREWREREIQTAALAAQLAQAQLQALKMQLQPHFLFNTLNSISALNHEDPKAANRMIARLSELLRLSLENDGAQEVALHQELDFLKRYLEIQQVRFGDRLNVRFDVAPQTMDARVPNLLLQPLVENAIQHGIAPFSAPGEIHIQVSQESGFLCLRVADNGPGLSAPKPGRGSDGIGLANTRARLRQLYGAAHRFELRNGAERGALAEVRIPFQTADAPETESAV